MQHSILVAMATTLDDEHMSRHTVSTVCTYVPHVKGESRKLWELECGQEQMENSILVAMATTIDDERMSRHTVSTVCTYVPDMKRES